MVALSAAEFVAYGPSHVMVLVVFTIGALLLVWLGRRQTDQQAQLFGRWFALLIMAVFLVALTYKVIRLDLQTSIPLQLCDIAELVAAVALWSHQPVDEPEARGGERAGCRVFQPCWVHGRSTSWPRS